MNISNFTWNWTFSSPHPDVTNSKVFQGVFYMIYTLIFILGVFGNVLVCYVVARNKNMQTVTNFFITNLALADILLCILGVPFTPLYTFLKQWIFGGILCHLVAFAQGVSVYISSLTLTSIAIDRYFVILYPFRPRIKVKVCVIIIVSVWLVAIVFTLPYGIYMKYLTQGDVCYCDEDWPAEMNRKIYSAFTFVLQFVVPFSIISFAYMKISFHLGHRAKNKPGARSSKKEELERERKRRTNRMLVAMVAIFGICWLPLNVSNMMNDFYILADKWKYFNLCFFVSHAIAMSSTCYNPFLYAWLNENFRREFRQVLPCISSQSNVPEVRTGRRSTGNIQTEMQLLNNAKTLEPACVDTENNKAQISSAI